MPPPTKETPALIRVEDPQDNLVELRQAYDAMKERRDELKEKLELAEEQFGVIKTAIEAELYKRSDGAQLADLRIAGVPGALRMRHKFTTRVDGNLLKAGWPEVYNKVSYQTDYWELRGVK